MRQTNGLPNFMPVLHTTEPGLEIIDGRVYTKEYLLTTTDPAIPEITTIDELSELLGMNWDCEHWHEQFMSRIEKLKSTGVIRHGEIVTVWWTFWPKAEQRKTERIMVLVDCELNTGEWRNICYGPEGIRWFR